MIHYYVQEYMERKREARRKRDMEQRYAMQRTEMEKRKKLEVHTCIIQIDILYNKNVSHLMRGAGKRYRII